MSEPKKSTRNKQIMDVAHPGKSAPSASARPVIVTNRPILKDPMMLQEAEQTVVPETPTVEVSRKVEITPPAKAAEPESAPSNDDPKTKTIAQLAEEAKARVDKAEADAKEATAAEAADEPAKLEGGADASTPGVEAEADQESKQAEDAKQDAALEKLAESKEYFLTINAVEQRRTKRFIVLGILLSIVLAIAWVDIALDAGIIQLDHVQPLTHFFSN